MHNDRKDKASGPGDGLRHLEMETPGISSATENTGLIPATPKMRSEREAYEALRAFASDPRR